MLTHWGQVMHVCFGNINHHWFRKWLVACSAQCHYLNQWLNIVNWTLRNTFQWHLNRNLNIFIEENTFENVVCEMAAILFRPQCVKTWVKLHSWKLFLGNGLSPGHHQAITSTNADLLPIGNLGTKFGEIEINIQIILFKEMLLKMSSAKWWPFC